MAISAFNCLNCANKADCKERPEDDFKLIHVKLRMTHICFTKESRKSILDIPEKTPLEEKTAPAIPAPFVLGQETSVRRIMSSL